MTTQCEAIEQYMRDHGSITTMQAFRDLGCTRLGARIHDLRQGGLNVASVRRSFTSRLGDKGTYLEYYIKDEGTNHDKR